MPIIKKFQKSTCEQTIQSLFLLPTLNTTASTFRPEHEDSHQGDEGGSAINSKTALILAVRNFLQVKILPILLDNVKMFVFEARGGRGQSIKYSNYG